MPTAAFMPELIAAYPSAKVILTQRDPDTWHKSCMDTVARFTSSTWMDILRYLDPPTNAMFSMINKMFDGVFGGHDRFATHGRRYMWKCTTRCGDWCRRSGYWSTNWARVGEVVCVSGRRGARNPVSKSQRNGALCGTGQAYEPDDHESREAGVSACRRRGGGWGCVLPLPLMEMRELCRKLWTEIVHASGAWHVS
jgi:hypothetical protein